MSEQIDIEELIKTSNIETFKPNLKTIVEKNVPIGQRLTLYNYIATDVYSQGYRGYGVDGWELGLEYLNVDEIEEILKADFLKTYGLALTELNQFEISMEYLNIAQEILNNRDDEILIDIYLGLSIVYKHLTHTEEALKYSHKAIKLAKKMDNSFEISRAYLNDGNIATHTHYYDEAEKSYREALVYAHTDEVKSNIFMSLGLLYANKIEYDKAQEMYEKAEELFIEMNFVEELFALYVNYGVLFMRLARFDEAEEHLVEALNYFEQTNDSYNIVICNLNLGRVEQDRANYRQASSYFDKAIALCERDDNLISQFSLLFYSRGNLWQSQKEYAKASDDYQLALEYAIAQQDRSMEASIKNALAGIEAERGNIESAQKIYQEILEVFQQENNIEEIVATYTNIALLYDEKGMYQLAQKSYQKALEMARTVDIPQLEISVLINLAEMFGTIMNISKAISTYNEALTLLERVDNDNLLSKCYLNLANIYESITEFKSALKYAKLGLALKEKLGQENALYIVHDALARIYDGLKQEEEAQHYYLKATAGAKQHNTSHYYGMMVNYGLFLFKFKQDIQGAIECYDKAKEYFEKHQKHETLIAIYSNYAMIYESQSEQTIAISYYRQALKYSEIFLSLIEDEMIMMKYRINFEHIYENLVQLYLQQKNDVEAFDALENLKSRTFTKILSSNHYVSDLIPIELLNQEQELKSKLHQILSSDTNIENLDSMCESIYSKLNSLYQTMMIYDEKYILLKQNIPINYHALKDTL